MANFVLFYLQKCAILPCYECRDFFKHVCLHKELHRSFVNFMRHFFPPHVTSKEFLMKIRQNCRSHYFTPFMRKNGTHSFYMTSYHKLKKARVVEIYAWHTSLRVDMVCGDSQRSSNSMPCTLISLITVEVGINVKGCKSCKINWTFSISRPPFFILG